MQFIKAIEEHTQGIHSISTGINSNCEQCQGENDIGPTEILKFKSDIEKDKIYNCFFSWHYCESCNTEIGGGRHVAHGLDKDNKLIHLEICTDCVLYYANGDVPQYWEQ